jgi:RNA polymerase sigma factor (sigma-70 family)
MMLLKAPPKVENTLEDKNALITEHMGFAYYFVNKYYPNFPVREDLFQAALLGMTEAAERFDHSRGSFITYARHWMKKEVNEEIERRNLLYIPHSDRAKLDSLRRAEKEGCRTLSEKSDYTDVPEEEILVLEELKNTPSDICDVEVGERDDLNINGLILENLMETLSEKDYLVIQEIYLKDRDVREVSEEVGVSYQAITQRRRHAIKKMREVVMDA